MIAQENETTVLSREQILAMPKDQVKAAFTKAQTHYTTLLRLVEPSNDKKPELLAKLAAAKFQYFLLNERNEETNTTKSTGLFKGRSLLGMFKTASELA